jgi:hypothetical protein
LEIIIEYQLQVRVVFSVRFQTGRPLRAKPSLEIQHLRPCDDDGPKRPIETKRLSVAENRLGLRLVRLAKRTNRHADNGLVDSLGLAGVTGYSYSLVDMQSDAVANKLAFIESDCAVINADHSPELVVEELLPAVFDVFRESDPVADSQRDLLLLENTEFPCLVEWQLLLDAVFSDNDSSLELAKRVMNY